MERDPSGNPGDEDVSLGLEVAGMGGRILHGDGRYRAEGVSQFGVIVYDVYVLGKSE